MRGPAINQLVYDFILPKPRATDPPNFQVLIQRHLVPEVRLETQAFYGHISSQEAKYPGLDYSFRPHRIRLSRYPWHRRLFRAFDNLALTKSEIACLSKWEGTIWAKERFEQEHGIVIRDTTADGIEDWVEPELRKTATASFSDRSDYKTTSERRDRPQKIEQESEHESEKIEELEEDQTNLQEVGTQIGEDTDEKSDTEIQSVGLALNRLLRAAVAQRRLVLRRP